MPPPVGGFRCLCSAVQPALLTGPRLCCVTSVCSSVQLAYLLFQCAPFVLLPVCILSTASVRAGWGDVLRSVSVLFEVRRCKTAASGYECLGSRCSGRTCSFPPSWRSLCTSPWSKPVAGPGRSAPCLFSLPLAAGLSSPVQHGFSQRAQSVWLGLGTSSQRRR